MRAVVLRDVALETLTSVFPTLNILVPVVFIHLSFSHRHCFSSLSIFPNCYPRVSRVTVTQRVWLLVDRSDLLFQIH